MSDLFGDWRLDELIAVGGLGEVWRAQRGDASAATRSTYSGSVAITISEISGIAANTSTHHASIGLPPNSTSCFGPPNRVPRPAATITAPQIMASPV